MKVWHLQQQDAHISEIVTKWKSKKCDKTLYYLDKHGIWYRKIMDGPNIFHAAMVPQTLQPYILHESHNALGHNGLIGLANLSKHIIIEGNYVNIVINRWGHVLSINRSHSKNLMMLTYTFQYCNFPCPSFDWIY